MVSWRLPVVLHGMQLLCSVSQAVRSISVKYSAVTKVKLEKMCCTGVQGRGPRCYTASSVSAETCTLMMFMQVNVESCVALEHVPNMLYFIEHLCTALRRTAQHPGQAQVCCFAQIWLVLFAPFEAFMCSFHRGPTRRHALHRSAPRPGGRFAAVRQRFARSGGLLVHSKHLMHHGAARCQLQRTKAAA